MYDSRVERALQPYLSARELPLAFWLFFARLHSRKRSGGVASMTRDRGYPDWLVLSARLLRSGYHSALVVFWLVAMCRYCSLLLCVVIFVTRAFPRCSHIGQPLAAHVLLARKEYFWHFGGGETRQGGLSCDWPFPRSDI